MTEPTIDARVSRLEGGYEHVATKADISRVEDGIKTEFFRLEAGTNAAIAAIRAEVQLLKWGMGLLVLLTCAILGAVLSAS